MKTTMFKKAIVSLTVSAAAIGAFALTANAYDLEKHEKYEIEEAYRNMYFNIHDPVDYTEYYTSEGNFKAGKMSEEDQQNTLNAINFCRYLAGLPYDVQISDSYCESAQNAAYVTYMNNLMDPDFGIKHHPGRSGNMYDNENAENNAAAERIFNSGASGCENSNLSACDFTPAMSVIGYLNDTEDSTVDYMGHRRWILNPDMKYTGAGICDIYSAIYAKDKSRQSEDNFTGDYILWPPAGYMPYELVNNNSYAENGYAYTVTLGNKYNSPDLGKVEVSVTTKSGFSKVFKQSDNNTASYFGINNNQYGTGKCIIFNPGTLPEDDEVTVKVTGIYDREGNEAPIEYTVKYFNLVNASDYTVGFQKSSYEAEAGRTVYICGYDNPLSEGDYTIYSSKSFKAMRNEGVYIYKIGANMLINSPNAITTTLYMGDDDSHYGNTATQLTFTHAHDRSDWIIDEEATPMTAGRRHRECTVCHEEIDSEVIPATSMNAAQITLLGGNYSWLGNPVEPRIKVTSGETELVKDRDYTVSYSEDYEQLRGTVTVTGIAPFTDSISAEYTFASKFIPITDKGFKVTATNTLINYQGRQVDISVTVKPQNSTPLVNGVDFYVEYDPDYSIGEHTAKVIGKGKYTDEVEINYTIIAAKIPNPFTKGLPDVIFDGTPKTVDIVMKNTESGVTLVEGVDYEVKYSRNNKVGTASVYVTGIGNYTATHMGSFDIIPDPDAVEESKNKTATISVSGTAPANDTSIILISKKDGKEYTADMKNGVFSADIPEGTYSVWVTCDGYCPRNYEYTVGKSPVQLNTDIYRFGDVDMSNGIDISDAVSIINNINGVSPLNGEQSAIGDVNLDGKVDIQDAVAVINNINGTSAIDVDNAEAINMYVKK